MATKHRFSAFWETQPLPDWLYSPDCRAEQLAEALPVASPIVAPLVEEIMARDLTIARLQKRLDDSAAWYKRRLGWLLVGCVACWVLGLVVGKWS